MRDGDSDGGDDDRREESEEQARASVFVGGGDMGALMRSIDWSTTPLGPVRAWPQSLRTSVSICLDSRFPILLWWGAELVMLYNDGYRAILGAKHPSAMGQRGKACWPEIWNIIGPMLEGVLRHGVATWSENQMLPLFRHGFDEECFFTFSYSPIRDRGRVAGVFCAVTETTDTVVGERRLRTLGDLAARTAGAVDAADVYRRAGAVLAENPHDIPVARLGIDAGVDAQASSSPELRVVDAAAVGLAPGDAGVTRAAVVPIGKEGTADVECLCAFGLHPRRTWDADYRRFLELVAEQIRAAVARARAWQAEQERAASLAALDRARTAFFSNVSHELRTPLTLILGPTESAVTSEGTARALIGEDLLVVRRNARRMLKLVNTLLEYSRIEAGRASVLFRPVDVGALTTDVASAFRSTVERAGLRLDVRAAPLDEQPFLDVDRWETIVLNLVSNAFKNTFAGAITVEIRSAPHGFELVVEDTGIGIPLEDQARIFERFHRVEGARSRTHEGTGIGLSLVQELVRLHGGSIRVDSVPGRGTRFTVTAPLGSAHLPRDRRRSRRAVCAAVVVVRAAYDAAVRGGGRRLVGERRGGRRRRRGRR